MPVLIRGRKNLTGMIGAKSHGRLLRILWEYSADDGSGLPSPHLCDLMAAFENALVPELEKGLLCVFFCVILHNGVKEWLAYTSDVQATCDRFNVALEDHEAFPVELSVEDDTDWKEYKRLLEETGMR